MSQIEMFDHPLQLGHYECLVCDNPELVKGWDGEKGEYIYFNKLHKIEIGMKWIFFCDSCFYQLLQQTRGRRS